LRRNSTRILFIDLPSSVVIIVIIIIVIAIITIIYNKVGNCVISSCKQQWENFKYLKQGKFLNNVDYGKIFKIKIGKIFKFKGGKFLNIETREKF
jgi:hypothetical protein